MDFGAILREGMTAIGSLLDGRAGPPNPVAALALAKAMQSLQPNPMLVSQAASDLRAFREIHPELVIHLPERYRWVDRQRGV